MTEKSHTTVLEKKAKKAIGEYNMLAGGDSVLVGFSGGADSTALLCFLAASAKEYGITVYAAHLNHTTRGADSDNDMRFCEELCRKLGITFFGVKKDVPALAKEMGEGLELAAREIRYRLFSELCEQHGIKKIATAHNAGDNAETVLFNLIRGTGPHGLCGIPPVRDNIIRPLIYCSKEEIIEYCKEIGAGYVTDKTNFENDYSRNFIRNEIMPLVRKLNGSAEEAFTRASGLLRADDIYFEKKAAEAKDISDPHKLAKLEDPILSRVIISRYREAVPSGELSHDHISEMIKYLREGRTGKRLSLPGDTDFFLDRDRILFLRHGEKIQNNPGENQDIVYGENLLSAGGRFFVSEDEKYINELKNIYKLFIYKKINSDKIVGKMYLRNRQNGDKYVCGGMTRSVKKMLSAADIPISRRGELPFLCDDDGILWIPGLPERDSVKFCGGKVLHLLFAEVQEVTEK